MFTITIFMMSLVFAFGFLVSNAFAGHQAERSTGTPSDFINMVGSSVLNPKGEYLGRVSNFVIDSKGHVMFAVVSHGGFLRIWEKDVAVPYGSFSYDQEKGHFVLDVTPDKLNVAPMFTRRDLYSEKWAEDVYRYFGKNPYWNEGELVEKGIKPMQEPIKPLSVFGDSIGPYGNTP